MIIINEYNVQIVTNDRKRTQDILIKKICQITVGICKQYNESIMQFIIQSFCIDGIIDTYNDLGYCKWKMLITNMIEHEIYERR